MERRDFIKSSVLGAGVLLTGFTGCQSPEEAEAAIREAVDKSKTRKQLFNMSGYAAPPIPVVRIGYVGVGSRGTWAVECMQNIRELEVKAICDIREKAVKNSQNILQKWGKPVAKEYFGDEYAWKKLCEQEDIDLVYIATPRRWHTPVAVYAMECGKHVAIEVPAAHTLDECWQLIETSERTKKHCTQLENCCYDFFEIMTTNMVQQGLFGEMIHAEGAYIHQLPESIFFGTPPRSKDDPIAWRWRDNNTSGNAYPTHGLGPVCWALNINRGDRMDYLTSMSSDDFTLQVTARRLANENNDKYYQEIAQAKYRGNMNSSIIRTKKGKTIFLQHDVSSPRPYDRLHVLSGTKGFAQKYPEPGKISFGHDFINNERMKELEERYTPEIVKHVAEAARTIGGHGGMDFIMNWRLIDCLRNGLPLDMDVYDAAAWSCITPLSVWSVANRSNSIDIPDFTCGSWENNRPVDLTLQGAGNTGIVGKE